MVRFSDRLIPSIFIMMILKNKLFCLEYILYVDYLCPVFKREESFPHIKHAVVKLVSEFDLFNIYEWPYTN